MHILERYGTGRRAEKLCFALKGINIVGVLDKDKKAGRFFDYPIIDWGNFKSLAPNSIIIAADAR